MEFLSFDKQTDSLLDYLDNMEQLLSDENSDIEMYTPKYYQVKKYEYDEGILYIVPLVSDDKLVNWVFYSNSTFDRGGTKRMLNTAELIIEFFKKDSSFYELKYDGVLIDSKAIDLSKKNIVKVCDAYNFYNNNYLFPYENIAIDQFRRIFTNDIFCIDDIELMDISNLLYIKTK